MARAHLFGALSALLVAASSQAQTAQDSLPRPTMDGRLRAEIKFVSAMLQGVTVPAAADFQLGNQEIATGAATTAGVAVARGNLVVRGRLVGDALVLHGDIIVYPGGVITGSAVAVDGRVHPSGGIIEGDVRSIRGITGNILARAAGRAADSRPVTTLSAIKMVLGWFAVLFVIGVGILLFAEKNLDGVVVALEQDFSRSFWTGVLAQLAAIPALLVVLVGLCVTVIGILLIPFAVVAYVIGLAGLLTLGFIAVARFTGRAVVSKAESRRTHLQALFAGIALYLAWWFLAAAFVSNPVAGSILRAVALATSWVGLTFGLGATIITRAGTRKKSEPAAARASDEFSWQTPTPVTGVVAARRPVTTVKQG
jgi:hypothetical protein